MITKLKKVDGGLALTIPEEILNDLEILIGSEVDIRIENNHIVIEKSGAWDSFFKSDDSVSEDLFKDRD